VNLLPVEALSSSKSFNRSEERIVPLSERVSVEGKKPIDHSKPVPVKEIMEDAIFKFVMLDFSERMLFGDPEDEPLDFSI